MLRCWLSWIAWHLDCYYFLQYLWVWFFSPIPSWIKSSPPWYISCWFSCPVPVRTSVLMELWSGVGGEDNMPWTQISYKMLSSFFFFLYKWFWLVHLWSVSRLWIFLSVLSSFIICFFWLICWAPHFVVNEVPCAPPFYNSGADHKIKTLGRIYHFS